MLSIIKGCKNVASALLLGQGRRLIHTVGNLLNKSKALDSCHNRKQFILPLNLLPVCNTNTIEDPINIKRNIDVVDHPITNLIIENPRSLIVEYRDAINEVNTISEPEKGIEKQAAQMIVIRRRKMKRHKLKKLRVKMKFEWAKLRQKREYRKEKEFQAELMGQIKEAEKFNPQMYAQEKIKKANEDLVPVLWKGKRLPQFIIKELMIKNQKRKEELIQNRKRREAMNLNVSDYKL